MVVASGLLSEISRLEKDVRAIPTMAESQIIKRERAKRESVAGNSRAGIAPGSDRSEKRGEDPRIYIFRVGSADESARRDGGGGAAAIGAAHRGIGPVLKVPVETVRRRPRRRKWGQ